MRFNIVLQRIILLGMLSGLIFLGAVFSLVSPQGSIQEGVLIFMKNIDFYLTEDHVVRELPVRIRIPEISVDASFEYVGIDKGGAMDTPKDPLKVGWFNLGAIPGERGTTVIAGHYGWRDDIPAVFDNLYKLEIGDKIFIEDGAGMVTIFVVDKIRIYEKDDIVPDVFSSSDGGAHLNLITCAGEWNTLENTRSERLVVFAQKE